MTTAQHRVHQVDTGRAPAFDHLVVAGEQQDRVRRHRFALLPDPRDLVADVDLVEQFAVGDRSRPLGHGDLEPPRRLVGRMVGHREPRARTVGLVQRVRAVVGVVPADREPGLHRPEPVRGLVHHVDMTCERGRPRLRQFDEQLVIGRRPRRRDRRRPTLDGSPDRPRRAAPCRCRRAARPRSTRSPPADPSPGRRSARRRTRPRRCRTNRAPDTTRRRRRASARRLDRRRSSRSSASSSTASTSMSASSDRGCRSRRIGVDVVVDVVVERIGAPTDARSATPTNRPTANPMPTSRIAATRTDPARRTARTVPGAGGRWGASALLDDSHTQSRLRKATSSAAPSRSICWSAPPS